MSHRTLLRLVIPALLLAASAARAQPAPKGAGSKAQAAEDTAITDTARQLYEDGLAALQAQRWAVARSKFLAAWGIHQHWQIAANLGFAEQKLGRSRDAAEHLSFYLREAPSTKVEERKIAEVTLKEALARVGVVTLYVVPEGAEVAVDGALVGSAPLSGPVFLEPGAHAVTARLDGYVRARVTVTATAGGSQEVTVRMLPEVAAAPSGAGGAPSEPGMASSKAAGPAVDGGGAPVEGGEAPAKRSLVPAIALGAGSVVGIAVGIGLTVASNGASDDADAQRATILGAGGQCVVPGSFAGQCDEMRSTRERVDTLANGAMVAFAAGGALAVGAAVYLLWPRGSAGARPAGMQVTPVVGARAAGVGVRGAW